MNWVVQACLAGATAVFMAANATLKTYAQKGGPWVLGPALDWGFHTPRQLCHRAKLLPPWDIYERMNWGAR